MEAHEPSAPRRRRAPVMSDVGRLAGVSHQTVSRVINGSASVRPETRDRVLQAMRELGYRPNPVARALATGRSNTIGVVSFDTTLYGPASTMLGIERAAHEAGYFTIIASLKALNRSSVPEAIERLRLHGVDGILVIAPQEESADAAAHAPVGEIPLGAVESGPAAGVPVISIDQLAGAVAATRHLLDLGHETVWHIAGPSNFLEAQRRLEGWRSELERAGAPVPEPLVGDWSARAGYEHGRALSRDPAVTAIFAANDQMALGALRALHESGRKLPSEVSLVGFDDIPEAPYFTPPLTTVRQDFDEMGSRSVRLLLRMMAGKRARSGTSVRPELLVRSSTAAAP
jgi:DNA-binding LacI/PurR family transcriptional regulator